MTAGTTTTLSRQNHDLQNQAIKSLFKPQHVYPSPNIPNNEKEEGSVQVIKVREAWAALPEEPVVAPNISDDVVRRIPRQRKGRRISAGSENLSRNDAENLERNLNDAINNNDNEEEEDTRGVSLFQSQNIFRLLTSYNKYWNEILSVEWLFSNTFK